MSRPIDLTREEVCTLAFIDQSASPQPPTIAIQITPGCQVVAFGYAAGHEQRLRLPLEVVSIGETHLVCRAIPAGQDTFGYPALIQSARFEGEASVPLVAIAAAHPPESGDANRRAFLLQNIPALSAGMLDRLADIAGRVPCETQWDGGAFIDDEINDEDEARAANRRGVWLLVNGLVQDGKGEVFSLQFDRVSREFYGSRAIADDMFPGQPGMAIHLERYYEEDGCDYHVVIASCDQFAVKLTNWLGDDCDEGSDSYMNIDFAQVGEDARRLLVARWQEKDVSAICAQVAHAVSHFDPLMIEMTAEKITGLFHELQAGKAGPVQEIDPAQAH